MHLIFQLNYTWPRSEFTSSHIFFDSGPKLTFSIIKILHQLLLNRLHSTHHPPFYFISDCVDHSASPKSYQTTLTQMKHTSVNTVYVKWFICIVLNIKDMKHDIISAVVLYVLYSPLSVLSMSSQGRSASHPL